MWMYTLYIKDAGYDKNIYLKYFDIVNPNTHTKFFLIANELMHLAEEAKEMDNDSKSWHPTFYMYLDGLSGISDN